MVKIRKFILPLTLVGMVTFLPKVLLKKDASKKKDKIKSIKRDYDINDDNLFI